MPSMKVTKKTIRECDTQDGKTIVLELEYTHKWYNWKLLVRDYNDKNYKHILKQLKKEVISYFNENIWQSNQT